jgi:mannosyltransferase
MQVTVAVTDPGGSTRDATSGARDDRAALAAVGALTLAALLLRVSQVHQSLFGDELWTYQQVAHHSLTGMFHAIRPPGENAPPLFFVLAWASAKVGDPTVWIRFPSLVLGAATVPVVYVLGRELAGRTAGVIAAALIAVNPFALYYGTEARPYATMAFFVAVSTVAIVKATRTGALPWWVLYVLSAAAAAYSGYTAIFPLAVQAGWSLWICRGRLTRPLLADAAIVLLYVPWLPHLYAKQLAVIGFLEPLTLHNALRDILRVIVGYPYASVTAIPTVPGLIVLAVCALAGAAALVVGVRTGQLRVARRGDLWFICALAAAAPVGVALYSSISTDIWDARDLYAAAPAMSVLLGTLLAAIPSRLRVAAVTAVLATIVFATVRAISPAYSRPAFRVAAHYLDRVAAPHDPIIVYPSFLRLIDVLPVEFQKPHTVISGAPGRWPPAPSGGVAVAIVEGRSQDVPSTDLPRPSGYALVGRRQYNGLFPFMLLTYRPVTTSASR